MQTALETKIKYLENLLKHLDFFQEFVSDIQNPSSRYVEVVLDETNNLMYGEYFCVLLELLGYDLEVYEGNGDSYVYSISWFKCVF